MMVAVGLLMAVAVSLLWGMSIYAAYLFGQSERLTDRELSELGHVYAFDRLARQVRDCDGAD